MDELETRLRSALAVMAADVAPSPELDARVATTVRSRQQRGTRWRWPALAAAVVLVVAGVVVVTTRRDSKQRVVDAGPPPPAAALVSGWDTSAPSPLSARPFASVVWTGREAIVWGGAGNPEAGDGGDYASRDGAAFDPVTGRWRRIADAPIAPRYHHVAVWTGREMIVFGGVVTPVGRTRQPDGAAYDPATDTWRLLPVSSVVPAPSRTTLFTAQAGVWTGRELIMWGRMTDDGYSGDGAAYDPATDTWRRVPPLPGNRNAKADLFATPGGVIASGRMEGPVQRFEGPQSTEPLKATVEADLFDPDAATWKPLPPSQVTPLGGIGPVWNGTELVVPGIPADGPPAIAEGLRTSARYSPDDGVWRSMADAPLSRNFGPMVRVAAGRTVVLVGLHGAADAARHVVALAYDPAEDRWRELPPPTALGADAEEFAAVWTGERILLWTGTRFVVSH